MGEKSDTMMIYNGGVFGFMSSLFVIALGLSTVFAGLIILIFVCKIMSFFCTKFGAGKKAAVATAPKTPAVIPNKPELVAAIGVAIAEDLGEDVSAIRIKSIRQI